MSRIYPPSFLQTPEGDVYCVQGDRNVRRWDGLLGAFVDSGVPAPSAACTVGSSTSGTIVGSIYAYVRFLDADGNVSNLSPVSSVHNIAVSTGSITAATNAGPIVITSAAHGLTNGQTVKVEGVIGNYAANGVWLVANKTTDTFELAGSIGSGTFITSGTWSKGAGQIDYTNIPTTTDTRVVKKQILRNKDGDTTVFYVDVELTNLADTSESSTNTDAQLTNAVALIDTTGRDLNIVSHAEPPNWKRFGCHFRGRMWLAGQLEYREGSVAVTNGSPTVTGQQTNWTSAMEGWRFFPLGASNTASYTISTINTGTQVITLTGNYGGSTDPYMTYCLTPPVLNSNGGAETRSLYFSTAGVPQSFNRLRSLTLEEQNQGAITGLIPYQNNLYVACERAMFRVIYSTRPETDAQVRGVVRRGLVNNRCWKIMDNMIFGMDRRGCYVFTEGDMADISDPISGIFDGTASTRINWRQSEYFHAAEFPDEDIVKWFVVLTGGFYPQHAICYSVRTKRWWIEEYSQPVTASTTASINGKQTALIALPSRRVGISTRVSTEGIPGNCTSTLRGTATSSGIMSLTDSAAAFTDDVIGTSVRIVSGTGIGQSRIIVTRTATKLTINNPWSIKPSTDSVYQIGGVSWKWRSGNFRWVRSEDDSRRTVEIVWKPTENSHQMSLKRFVNFSADPTNYVFDNTVNSVTTVADTPDAFVDTTDQYGHARQEYTDLNVDRSHGTETVRLQIEGTTNNEPLTVYTVSTEGATK